ncbi:hypothetical protein BPAE_0088g00370 [Botrytis paeoniae]|uniref:Ubiquitin-like protease family profile domain-containing protein n=1 Tax=Botrytis paeoniae TaxID=278948 RepID=A0A4Z1FKV2_9HELO|nr:hypothetical protein BPAE_0088g00370 [Botrytis paeoniae]
MPPTNRVTEFVNSNKPTAKEFIPFLKKQDATFWHLVFSESAILEAMTSHEVLKDISLLEGQQLQALFAELQLSGEEKGPKWVLSDECKEIPLERVNGQEYISSGSRGAKMWRSNKREREAMGEGEKDNVLCTQCEAVPDFHRRKSGPISVSSLPLEFQADDAEPIQKRCKSGSPVPIAKSSAPKSCDRAINFDPKPIPLSFDDQKSPDIRSQVPDMLVASIDKDAYRDASKDEPSSMELDNNISSPSSLIAQSKLKIALKSSPLTSQPVVLEKKNLRKEIDLTDETFDKKRFKEELEWESADSDLPLEHFQKLITISQIFTCAKKNKIGAEISQVRCDFELHNLVDEAGMSVDPTSKNLKQGNPVDIRKGMYYEKLAKMNFLRAGGNLATCTEKDLKPFLDDCRKQKRVGIKVAQLEGGENKTGFKKWSVARLSVLCTLIHSSQSAFAKNLRILAKAFVPFLHELSNDLDIEALLKELDSRDLHSEGLEDSWYQHYSSDNDKMEELFEEFPGTSSVFYKGTSSNPGIAILLEDLQKFAEGIWLSDTVVDAVMHLYREKKPKDLYLLRSSNLETFNNKPKEAQKGLRRMYIDSIKGSGLYFNQVLCIKAFARHWTTQLAQITTPVGPKAIVNITIKVWDSLENDHTSTLDFQRWLTEVFMLEEDPKTAKCSVQRMNSMRQLNLDDCVIIALHNAIAIYHGEADIGMFSEEWSRQERYRFCSMVVQHAKKLYRDRRV